MKKSWKYKNLKFSFFTLLCFSVSARAFISNYYPFILVPYFVIVSFFGLPVFHTAVSLSQGIFHKILSQKKIYYISFSIWSCFFPQFYSNSVKLEKMIFKKGIIN